MKRIIICGAGEVGRYAAEVLAKEGHNVTIVDCRPEKLRAVEEVVDVSSIKGYSTRPKVLQEAGIENCDLLIAATNQDEINLLTANLGKKMGAERVVARIHHRAYIDNELLEFGSQFDIDHLICPEQLTSNAITGNLEDPGVMAIERFAQNRLEMHRYTVKRDSEAIGTQLAQLTLPRGMRFAVVNRQGHCFTPVSDTVLRSEDIVTLIGEGEHFKSVQHMFHHHQRRENSVVLMGGTSMAEWLAEDLARRHYSIRLFETNHARAVELSERLPNLTVIQADPTDPQQFQEEHLEETAAFIAVTENDEHNILGALQAKQLGAPLVAAVIYMPTYLALLENLGVDWPFSPRIVAAKELLKFVDDSPVRRLTTLAEGVVDVYEVGPVVGGDAVGKPLIEIALPKGCFIAAIQRGPDVCMPGPQDSVEKNDVLVLIGAPNAEKSLRKLFMGS